MRIRLNTVDLEIFVLQKFRVLNFRVKIFRGLGHPRKFFDGIKIDSTFPGSVIWNHAAVGELHAWEREPKNTIGTYCGYRSKDGRFIGHRAESLP